MHGGWSQDSQVAGGARILKKVEHKYITRLIVIFFPLEEGKLEALKI